MTPLNTLAKPILPKHSKEQFQNSQRPMGNNEVLMLKEEIERLSQVNRIRWNKTSTYIPAIGTFLLILYISHSVTVGLIFATSAMALIIFVPALLKGDSFLLKKDIDQKQVNVKVGPVSTYSEKYGRTTINQKYVDDIIVDGTYSLKDEPKFKNFEDGDIVKLEYSPNANFIFKLEHFKP
jgi:hypothetical protein